VDQNIVGEVNRLKRVAGQELEKLLAYKFNELCEQQILKAFKGKTNFNHIGFTYTHQYKANFVVETIDNKFIILNYSSSHRDRHKQDLYDFHGIMHHTTISKDIIASILLYPDEEFERNGALRLFRDNAENKVSYCPATHVLSFSETVSFLENYADSVSSNNAAAAAEEAGRQNAIAGLNYEKHIVSVLNAAEHRSQYISNSVQAHPVYTAIMDRLCSDYGLDPTTIITVEATDTVKRLRSGGNAKTDVVIRIKTNHLDILETISVKNTSQKRVTCHEYSAKDFTRVLKADDTRLEEYFSLYQESGSDRAFKEKMPVGYSVDEFEVLLKEKLDLFMPWVMTGANDDLNLVDPTTQVARYVLFNKSQHTKFCSFEDYERELFGNCKLLYGTPLSWTYPSKKRGKKIQLKLPVLM